MSERGNRWRERHPDRVQATRRATKLRIRAYIAKLRDAAKCAFCGSSDRIDWHHPDEDGTTKNRLGNAARDKWSYERIDAEIARCVPLCHIHHAREHALSRRAAGFQPTEVRPIREARLAAGDGYRPPAVRG